MTLTKAFAIVFFLAACVWLIGAVETLYSGWPKWRAIQGGIILAAATISFGVVAVAFWRIRKEP